MRRLASVGQVQLTDGALGTEYQRLGLPPGSCDLAFISETYHHFDRGTQVAYLKGLRSTAGSPP